MAESALAYLSAVTMSVAMVAGSEHGHGGRLGAQEVVLEEGAVSAPADEVLDGLDFVDALAAVPELGPACEVLAAGLRRSLHAHGELARAGGSLVGPREVADKRFLEIDPCVDAAHRQAVQPSASRSLEHERCIAHGETTIYTVMPMAVV